jgi:hypothetical protein
MVYRCLFAAHLSLTGMTVDVAGEVSVMREN